MQLGVGELHLGVEGAPGTYERDPTSTRRLRACLVVRGRRYAAPPLLVVPLCVEAPALSEDKWL